MPVIFAYESNNVGGFRAVNMNVRFEIFTMVVVVMIIAS
jgi:hypothetical protein